MTAPADAAAIRQRLPRGLNERIDTLEILTEIDSTNSYLLRQPPPAAGQLRVALASMQTAGRGRLENRWTSAPGAGLYLSAAFTAEPNLRNPGSLTPAVGVAVTEALRQLGLTAVQLKWPNDLVLADGKLGGILCELYPGPADVTTVVIGIGINLQPPRFAEGVTPTIGRAASLSEYLGPVPLAEELAALVICELDKTVGEFAACGFAPFQRRFASLDWLAGREIVVRATASEHRGRAVGIGDEGQLLLAADDAVLHITSGTIELAGND